MEAKWGEHTIASHTIHRHRHKRDTRLATHAHCWGREWASTGARWAVAMAGPAHAADRGCAAHAIETQLPTVGQAAQAVVAAASAAAAAASAPAAAAPAAGHGWSQAQAWLAHRLLPHGGAWEPPPQRPTLVPAAETWRGLRQRLCGCRSPAQLPPVPGTATTPCCAAPERHAPGRQQRRPRKA